MPTSTLFPTLARWVGLDDLRADSLLPGYYAPAYLGVDRMLRAAPNGFVEVGDLVEPIHLHQIVGSLAPLASNPPLNEVILIPRHLRHELEQIPIIYQDWSGKKFPIELDRSMIILGPKSALSIAWIAHELRQSYCQTQLGRVSESGTVLRHLAVFDVLRTRIKSLPSTERDRLSRQEKGRSLEGSTESRLQCEEELAPREQAQTLVWATHEERRQEFEKYITEKVDAIPVAFAEAVTSNQQSDLFAVRLLFEVQTIPRLEFADVAPQSEANMSWWKGWYWNGSADGAVLSQLLSVDDKTLPIHLLNRVALPLAVWGMGPDATGELLKVWRRDSNGRLLLPAISQVGELAGTATAQDVPFAVLEDNRTFLASFLVTDGFDRAGQERLIDLAAEFLGWVFRPLLAVRLVREQQTIGVYLLAGLDQFLDPSGEALRMQKLGEELLHLLRPGDLVAREAVRKESLRRLSWFSHQINSPIGIAAAALQDVRECLQNHSAIAEMLVPDPDTALRVARMAKQPVESYQMMSRLEVALQAIQDLRRVNYQIRQLRRVQGDLSLVECDLEAILNEEIRRARDSMPGVLITPLSETGTTLVADPQFLKEAFQEVFNNSLRELRSRKTDNPTIEVQLRHESHQIHVSICDNGLPPLNNLIDQPFEEDASTYATQGQGSGLGLTMVREIMLRHGGSCSLRANVDDEGARLPGVTFLAILPNPKLPITPLLPL
jgi:signal transduction histidine kinase